MSIQYDYNHLLFILCLSYSCPSCSQTISHRIRDQWARFMSANRAIILGPAMETPIKIRNILWLVVWTILKNMKSMGRIIPYIMGKKKCSKPPTSMNFVYILLAPEFVGPSTTKMSRLACSHVASTPLRHSEPKKVAHELIWTPGRGLTKTSLSFLRIPLRFSEKPSPWFSDMIHPILLHALTLPPGNLTYSYWTWWFIVDLPIENGDVP